MTFPVLLLLFYIIVEYGRPGFLAPLRPGLLVQGLLVLCLFSNSTKVRQVLKEKYFRLYLLLLVFMSFQVFVAANYFYALICLKAMVSYLVIGLACCIFLDNLAKLNLVLVTLVLVLATSAVSRVSGINMLGITGGKVFADENDFALAMNIALPFSFFLGRIKKGWKRWLLWLAGVALILGNMVTSSRGGFVGMVAVGFICWLYVKHRMRTIPVIAILAILAWSFVSPYGKERIMAVGLDSAQKDTGKDRVELWKVGWKMFIHNPVTGIGQGNIPVAMNKYRFDERGESFWKQDMWGRMTHSVYFTLLPELGLIGVAIFVAMLKDLYARKKRINWFCTKIGEDSETILNMNNALMVSVLAFLITGIFLSVLYYPPFWNLSALAVTLFMISSRVFRQQVPPAPEEFNDRVGTC
ncbi:hypothetical protein GSbR_27590 [Geobacter sp. SVR]|nr:hypothetical protein GSVR_32680 [Geobacter sp. SVR]GCF86159.1 hypothetical protein GSbR_27590 [Geobacter sp. SVR]